MIESSKHQQFLTGIPMAPAGITIHATNTDYSATECISIMESSTEPYASHFFADETGVYQALPYNQGCYHTGKGLDDGNLKTISIEICRTLSRLDLAEEAVENAVTWIKEIRKEIGDVPVYFHQDFNQSAYCPAYLLERYESKQNFIDTFGLEH